MNATTTETSVGAGRRSTRAVDRPRRRREAPLRDTTALVQRGRRLRRDDESRTPPHGDAVLPRHSRAR